MVRLRLVNSKMKLTWKKCTATAISVATAVVVIFQAVETVYTKFDRMTTAIEERDMGPSAEEVWRYGVDAKIDTLELYHQEEDH